MKISTFKQIFCLLCKVNCFKRLAAKYNTEVEENGDTYKIRVFDNKKEAGILEFNVNNNPPEIHILTVIINPKYIGNASVVMSIYNKFEDIYNSKYNGYPLAAEFYNQNLQQFFDKMIEKGRINPSDTSKMVTPNNTEEQYQEWLNDAWGYYYPDDYEQMKSKGTLPKVNH